MSKPQQENLNKLRDDIVEQITRIKGLRISQMGPKKRTGKTDKSTEGEVDWNEKHHRTLMASENYSTNCPSYEDGKYCKACATYYVSSGEEAKELEPPLDKPEEVNLVQESKVADETILEIVTRSKGRSKMAPKTKKKSEKGKTYSRPHLVPNDTSPPNQIKTDTGISDRAKRYMRRCRNPIIPRFLTDAPDPEISVPLHAENPVKLMDTDNEITIPEDVPGRELKGGHQGEEKSYERLTRAFFDMPESSFDDLEDEEPEKQHIEGLKALDCLTNEDWAKEQEKDPILKRVKKWVIQYPHGVPEEELELEETEIKAYLHLGDNLRIIQGVLLKEVLIPVEKVDLKSETFQNQPEMEMKYQKLVPKHMTLGLFRVWHGRPESAHLYYQRLYPVMRERFFWLGMAKDIQKWTRACHSCQIIKGMGKHTTRMGLKTEEVTRPMQRVGVDVLGPWPMPASGNRFIIIYQDYFSKWVEIFAARNHTAYVVAEILVKEIISRYGIMEKLHSDQGREFESQLYQEVCRLWNIKKTRTSPYTAWSNGQVERINATVKTMVKHVDSAQNTWDRFLHYLRMAYNFTEHKSTKCTPFRLFFSRCSEPTVPLDLVYGTQKPEERLKC
jgi:hypothetical protein